MCGRFTIRSSLKAIAEVFGLAETSGLLRPYPSIELTDYPIRALVNNPQDDVAACIEPPKDE